MIIDIDEKVAQVLKRLEAQAAEQNMAFDQFLENLEMNTPVKSPSALTAEEFDNLLDELAEGSDNFPTLPADFSREDIYFDHD